MEASPVVSPEQIALQRAPNARHVLSVSKLYGGVQEIARIAKIAKIAGIEKALLADP
jgi:hypothetical protein